MNPSTHRAAQRRAPFLIVRVGRAAAATTVAAAAAALLACAATAAVAASPAGGDADAAYQRDVAACKAGQTGEALATCMKEAGAARDLARKGKLEPDNEAYDSNALKRCKSLEGDDRADCVARIKGAGTTSGSVAGGGILRERVTTQVGTPASGARP